MARLLFALVLAAAAFTQATLLPALPGLQVWPSPVLVLLLVWSALRGVGEGLLWVFGAGVLLDTLAMDPLGTNGLALMIVAVLAGPARRRFFHSGMIFPLALTFVATVLHALVLALVRGGGAATPDGGLTILTALFNMILVPPLYLVAGWMDRWVLESRS